MCSTTYIWRPTGHGPLTFIVAADSENEAFDLVDKHVHENYLHPWGTYGTEAQGWPEGYQLEVLTPGLVVEHFND